MTKTPMTDALLQEYVDVEIRRRVAALTPSNLDELAVEFRVMYRTGGSDPLYNDGRAALLRALGVNDDVS